MLTAATTLTLLPKPIILHWYLFLYLISSNETILDSLGHIYFWCPAIKLKKLPRSPVSTQEIPWINLASTRSLLSISEQLLILFLRILFTL